MNITLFFVLVGLLGAIYIWIGKSASQELQTDDDYFLMGRKLTMFPLSLTLLATQLGGGTLLGAAQEAYDKGWCVLFYPLGVSLGFFALGCGFGGKLRRLNISTVAEVFEKVYGSRTQRYIASLFSILTLFFALVGQGIAARMFFVAIGVENPLIFIASWIVLVAYTVMGGLKAVIKTDILQALFIIGALCLAFFAIGSVDVSSNVSLVSSKGDVSEVPWVGWLFMPFLFMLIEQDMGQRCFAAKTPRVISFASVAAGFLLLGSSTVAIYFGVLARQLGIEVGEGTSILVEAVTVLTNPVVTTFFVVAILLGVVSTADSLLCSISSNLSYDFLAYSKLSSGKRLTVSRGLTLAVGVGALGVTYLFDKVVSVLIISYECSSSVLFVPIMGAIFLKNPSKVGAYFSMGLGALGFVLFRYIELPIAKEFATLTLSLVGYLAGQQVESSVGNLASAGEGT